VTRALADASALLLLAKHTDAARLVEIAAEIATLDLAVYETGNAIWKQARLLKLMSEGEAREAQKALSTLISRISMVRVDELNHAEAMGVALEQGIAYYDACYLVAAKRLGLPLATEDRKLAGLKAGQRVVGWKQLLGE